MAISLAKTIQKIVPMPVANHIHDEVAYERGTHRAIIANARKGWIKNTPDADAIIDMLMRKGTIPSGHGSYDYAQNFFGSLMQALDDYGKLTERQTVAARKALSSEIRWSNEKKRRWAEANEKRHTVGAIGEVIQLELTLVKRHEFYTSPMHYYDSGFRMMHVFVDQTEEQNSVVYYGTAKDVMDLDIGMSAVIKATVKSHSEWNGCPQTVISRPKVVK